jgi:NEMP family
LLPRPEDTSSQNVPIGVCKYTLKYATKSGLFSYKFHLQVEIRGPAAASWSVYLGSTAAEVEKSYEGHQSVFSWLTTQSQGPREVQLTPFNSSCLGVAVTKREGVEARLTLLHVSYYRLGACLAGKNKTFCSNKLKVKYIFYVSGVFLFFLAPRLARSKVCHYFSGVSFGVLASALILTFLIWRLVPKVCTLAD